MKEKNRRKIGSGLAMTHFLNNKQALIKNVSLQDLTPKLLVKVCQVNNSVIFNGKPIGPEEFLNQMVEALGITIDRRPKGRLRELES